VTLARGEESSRPVQEIIDEINFLHSQDIKEVVLTGVHLGGYGSDLNTDLVALVRHILASTEVPRIRLGSLEPWELHDGFWALFDNPRVMPHLHLPLQSGANSVLRRMARRCKTEEFQQLVTRAREVNPRFNITTDIIVGFPGETDDEWQQTLDFVASMNFGHVHIFAFSPREGTKAATLANPVSRDTKRARSQTLHDLALGTKTANMQAMCGETIDVLIEGNEQYHEDGSITWFGYTPNFHRVAVTTRQKDLCNQVKSVRIDACPADNSLTGQFV
jgi:threonylcarbamoyladenosine tRNA methylthiotransferase MtaB